MDILSFMPQTSGKNSSLRRLVFFRVASALVLISLYLLPVYFVQGAGLAGAEPVMRALLAPDAQDLQIIKEHVGDFQIGTDGAFIVTVSNAGNEQFTGSITVTDSLPNGLAPVSAAGSGWEPCNLAGQLVTCVHQNTAGLAVGASLSPIIITVSVGQAAAPQVTNIVTLSSNNDTTSTNNQDTDVVKVVSADLAVTKTVLPANVTESATITYTISLSNNGPSDTTGVELTDTLPTGVTLLTQTPSQGTYTPSTGLWSVGNLIVGQTATLTISAMVNAGTRGQTITNTITGVSSALYDYNTSNNTDDATVRVLSTRVIGQITSALTGNALASASVQLTDSASHVYTTSTNASGWYTFTETTSLPISAGSATIRTRLTGYADATSTVNLAANSDNLVDQELDTTELTVTKSDGSTTILPGATITYNLTISNTGTIAASNLIITDVLPSYLTYITDTLDITHSVPTTGTLVWVVTDDLPPDDDLKFALRVKVADALPISTTKVKNTVRVGTDSPEANRGNNEASDENTPAGTPNIAITMSASPTTVQRGQSTQYTILVDNNGTVPVTKVVVEATFSTFLDISASTNLGKATVNTTTRKVTIDIDVLGADKVATIRVNGRVNNTLTVNRSVTQNASMVYTFNGQTSSTRTSNSVVVQLIATSTLPGTGWGEPGWSSPRAGVEAHVVAFYASLLLALIGLGALVYGIRARKATPDWSAWALRMGAMMIVAAMLFGIATQGLRRMGLAQSANLQKMNRIAVKAIPIGGELDELPPADLSMWLVTEEPETLPNFPIPTPTVAAGEGVDEETLDKSPTERILIPAIGVDTVVKYVPFDGLTWLISGLREEVAWMGDTSWPGLGGNTGLAGHVTLRGGGDGPFRYLDQLASGDQVTVYTQQNVYTYQVNEMRVVSDADFTILTSNGKSELTLITCTNWDTVNGIYKDRLMVKAGLVTVQPLEISGASSSVGMASSQTQ